jgi:transcriptional regulator NrdR family protein
MPPKKYQIKTNNIACPLCRCPDDSRVVDSRAFFDDIRRRRECSKCKGRFTTYERVDGAELVLPTLEAMTQVHKDRILRAAAAIVNAGRAAEA